MVAKLVAEEGLLKGLVLSLEEGKEWVIGRDPDLCQILVEDPSASRKHLLCKVTDEGFLAENISTTNPAQVNGEPLLTPKLLKTGDLIKIGEGLFRFYANEEPLSSVTQNDNDDKESDPVAEAAFPIPQVENTEEERHDSIFEEVDDDQFLGPEINFDLLETGRWLLKVIGGPNNGAEFSMQPGGNYLIGTDPTTCDIIFHDTSVSRQHIKISIADDDTITIEDLNSRNGTFIESEKLQGKKNLPLNTVVTVGTTSFVIYDREGEMQTIISPLLPSIVKVLQREEEKKEEEKSQQEKKSALALEEKQAEEERKKALSEQAEKDKAKAAAQEKVQSALGAFILIGIITGLFVIIGLGVATLFKGEPVVIQEQVDVDRSLRDALGSFPSVRYSFNKSTGNLLLVGHINTASDRSQLLYNLKGLTFIKNIDDAGVVIDEYVWQETNQVLSKNPNWKGITIQSPMPGKFILSGYLQTRKQAELLTDYINSNFPYLDLLEKKVVVEEDLLNAVTSDLQTNGLREVTAQMSNGELTLGGGVPAAKREVFNKVLADIKALPGIRGIKNLTTDLAAEQSMINLSGKYEISGYSDQGRGRVTLVINGKILSKGDVLDGMVIREIKPNAVFLERDGIKYRIDYSR